MKRSLWHSALVLLLAGCSMPYKSPHFNSIPGTVPQFDGVAHLLKKSGTLDVLFVHGMCTHDADWAKTAVQGLYETMGGDPAKVELKPSAVEHTGIILYRQNLALPAGSLRVNAILWSPVTTPLKADLCYDQTNKSELCPASEKAKTYPYQRASFNQKTKDVLLNDCLSDALIYQGKSRVQINERMQTAILQAINTTHGQVPNSIGIQSTAPMVIITDSLGSKVTFDAVFKLAGATGKSQNKAGIQLFNRTAQVFMRANQMPLLALADKYLDGTVTTEKDDSGFPADPIQGVIQRRNSEPGPKSINVPNVVAFSDPNDLLSFPLVGSPHSTRVSYPIVDVIVSNDDTYFGYVELPNTAHSDYTKNEAVRQLVACGKPRSSACKN